MKNNDAAAVLQAAYAHVHTDEDNLVCQVAAEHAIANMGQDIMEFIGYASATRPESAFRMAFDCFYGQSESDDMAEGTMDEYKSWFKQAKKDIKLVKKHKLPLTFMNVKNAFDRKGPFAKEK